MSEAAPLPASVPPIPWARRSFVGQPATTAPSHVVHSPVTRTAASLHRLSKREQEVLPLLCLRLSDQEIALAGRRRAIALDPTFIVNTPLANSAFSGGIA